MHAYIHTIFYSQHIYIYMCVLYNMNSQARKTGGLAAPELASWARLPRRRVGLRVACAWPSGLDGLGFIGYRAYRVYKGSGAQSLKGLRVEKGSQVYRVCGSVRVETQGSGFIESECLGFRVVCRAVLGSTTSVKGLGL